jgi:hypothetical protein
MYPAAAEPSKRRGQRMLIQDHPDWPELVELCYSKAADFALYYAGQTDESMSASLRNAAEELRAIFSKTFDADVTSQLVQAFVTAVASRKSEIDIAAPQHDRNLN